MKAPNYSETPVMPNNFLRNLPSVNQLLESPQLKNMVETINHSVVAEGVRTFLDDLRTQVVDAAGEMPIPTPTEMADKIADWLSNEERPYLRRVINGTGIILHTGLGRAPLAAEALSSVDEISKGYAGVTFGDFVNGRQCFSRQRGSAESCMQNDPGSVDHAAKIRPLFVAQPVRDLVGHFGWRRDWHFTSCVDDLSAKIIKEGANALSDNTVVDGLDHVFKLRAFQQLIDGREVSKKVVWHNWCLGIVWSFHYSRAWRFWRSGRLRKIRLTAR